MRNHTGDLIRPKGANYDWFCDEETKTHLHPKDGGKPEAVKEKRDWIHLAAHTTNYNGDNDQWNVCEIIVMGD
ncbi:MAG: hypothetical protein ACJA08_000225 [Cyclobacteriaceae bacterium]|jgi:hypothetical protein